MGWNIVMLRQAGLSFRTRKKNQAKNSRKFKTRAQVTKKLKEIMGNRNLPEFLQNNSRIFWKTLGIFFRKLKNFSKNSRIFQIYSRIFPQILDLPDFFLLVLC